MRAVGALEPVECPGSRSRFDNFIYAVDFVVFEGEAIAASRSGELKSRGSRTGGNLYTVAAANITSVSKDDSVVPPARSDDCAAGGGANDCVHVYDNIAGAGAGGAYAGPADDIVIHGDFNITRRCGFRDDINARVAAGIDLAACRNGNLAGSVLINKDAGPAGSRCLGRNTAICCDGHIARCSRSRDDIDASHGRRSNGSARRDGNRTGSFLFYIDSLVVRSDIAIDIDSDRSALLAACDGKTSPARNIQSESAVIRNFQGNTRD